jgi:mannose-6-phosphate isomerase-like protein (cupin superfamily)
MKTLLLLVAFTSFVSGWIGRAAQEAKPLDHAGFHVSELAEQGESSGRPYLPFLDRTTLSAGLYRLAAGSTDGQSPHELDEMYYVVAGKSGFTAGGEEYDVETGTILFVAKDVPHQFHDIEEDLEVVVFFSKAREEEADSE